MKKKNCPNFGLVDLIISGWLSVADCFVPTYRSCVFAVPVFTTSSVATKDYRSKNVLIRSLKIETAGAARSIKLQNFMAAKFVRFASGRAPY